MKAPTRKEIASAVIRRLSHQFPTDGESRLMFAVVANAIKDAFCSSYSHDAVRYLKEDLIHAEICGVDPEWIRATIKKAGIDLEV